MFYNAIKFLLFMLLCCYFQACSIKTGCPGTQKGQTDRWENHHKFNK